MPVPLMDIIGVEPRFRVKSSYWDTDRHCAFVELEMVGSSKGNMSISSLATSGQRSNLRPSIFHCIWLATSWLNVMLVMSQVSPQSREHART